MRVLLLAAGLTLVASAASAASETQIVSRSATNLTLVNGCSYAPEATNYKTWTLRESAAAHSDCAKRVRERAPKLDVVPTYLVGVYR